MKTIKFEVADGGRSEVWVGESLRLIITPGKVTVEMMMDEGEAPVVIPAQPGTEEPAVTQFHRRSVKDKWPANLAKPTTKQLRSIAESLGLEPGKFGRLSVEHETAARAEYIISHTH